MLIELRIERPLPLQSKFEYWINNTMGLDEIAKNYGLLHISENIFKCLSKVDLMDCRLVNKSFKKILDRSAFWFRMLDSDKAPVPFPANDYQSWKSWFETYKAWKMLVQKIVKTNTQSEEEFVLLFISKIYKNLRIELIHPLDIAAKLEKVKKYPDMASFIRKHADDPKMKKHSGKFLVLCHNSNGPLGFCIRDGTLAERTPEGLKKIPGIFISRINAGGLAESSGFLTFRDEVLEVNGIEVAGKSSTQVADMMRANRSNLIITLKKWANKGIRREIQTVQFNKVSTF